MTQATRLPAIAVLAALALTACSGGDPAPAAAPAGSSATAVRTGAAPKPAATSEPRTAAAVKAAATASVTAFAAGDYAGAWDYFTAADKKRMPRADYARVSEACHPGGTGIIPTVAAARPEGDAFVVTLTVLGVAASRTWQYEDGHWRQEASAETLANAAKGVDGWLAAMKADGSCA